MAFITAHDGAQIYYETQGQGAVNLLLLHGLGGGASELWHGVIEHLDLARCRVICPDFRGQGKSSPSPGGYTWGGFSRDILAVADHAGVQRFIPVGFSFGGKLACYLAAKHRDRVVAQALIAPVALGTVPLEREAGLQLCRDAADWRRTREFFRSWWFGPVVDEDLLDACCQSVAGIPTFVLEACVEMSLWTSLTTDLGQLTLPTLVVTGQHDPVYHGTYQREQLLPYLKHAELAALDCGHFIPLEKAAELAGLVSRFATAHGADCGK